MNVLVVVLALESRGKIFW